MSKEERLARRRKSNLAYYYRNREKELERSRRYNANRRELCRALVRERRSQPCVDCGIQYPPWVMDFDHVRGEKVATVAYLTSCGRLAALERELDKCEVRCANCHRLRHGDQTHG